MSVHGRLNRFIPIANDEVKFAVSGKIREDDADCVGEERRPVGLVSDPVDVLLEAPDVVAVLVQGGMERRLGDWRVAR